MRLHALARPAGLELALFDLLGLGFGEIGITVGLRAVGLSMLVEVYVAVRLTDQSLAELLGSWTHSA